MTTIQRNLRAPVKPSASLFSPVAVLFHTILFTPLVGGGLVLANWARLGRWKRGAASVGVGLGALTLLIGLGVLIRLQSGSANAAIAGVIAGTLGLAFGWQREQKTLYDAHQMVGGQKAASWPATIAGIVMMGVVVGLTLRSNMFSQESTTTQTPPGEVAPSSP